MMACQASDGEEVTDIADAGSDHSIFPIRVEPETDSGSQCRDYNTLRPSRVYRVVMF